MSWLRRLGLLSTKHLAVHLNNRLDWRTNTNVDRVVRRIVFPDLMQQDAGDLPVCVGERHLPSCGLLESMPELTHKTGTVIGHNRAMSESVRSRRSLNKLLCIMYNPSHPLHEMNLEAYSCDRSWRAKSLTDISTWAAFTCRQHGNWHSRSETNIDSSGLTVGLLFKLYALCLSTTQQKEALHSACSEVSDHLNCATPKSISLQFSVWYQRKWQRSDVLWASPATVTLNGALLIYHCSWWGID